MLSSTVAPSQAVENLGITDLKNAFFSDQSDQRTKTTLLRNITEISGDNALAELLLILNQLDQKPIFYGYDVLARSLESLPVDAREISSLSNHKNQSIRLVVVNKAARNPEENRGILLASVSDSSKAIVDIAVDSLVNSEKNKAVFDQNLVEALLKNINSSSCDLTAKVTKVFPALSLALTACPLMTETVCQQISQFAVSASELKTDGHDNVTIKMMAKASLEVIATHSGNSYRELFLKFLPQPFGRKVYGSSLDGRIADLLKISANALAELNDPNDNDKWKLALSQNGRSDHWLKSAAVNYLKKNARNIDLLLSSSDLGAIQAGVELCVNSGSPENLLKLKNYCLNGNKNYHQIEKIIQFLLKDIEQNWGHIEEILKIHPQYNFQLIRHLHSIEKPTAFEQACLEPLLIQTSKNQDLSPEAIIVLLKWNKLNPEVRLEDKHNSLALFVSSYQSRDFKSQAIASEIYSQYPQAFQNQPEALVRILGITNRDIALKAERELFSDATANLDSILYVARFGPPDMAERAVGVIKSNAETLKLALEKLIPEQDALLKLSLTSKDPLSSEETKIENPVDMNTEYQSREVQCYLALLEARFDDRIDSPGAAERIIYQISSQLPHLTEETEYLNMLCTKDVFLCHNSFLQFYKSTLLKLLNDHSFRNELSKRVSINQVASGNTKIQGPGFNRRDIPSCLEINLEPSQKNTEEKIQYISLSATQYAIQVTVDNTSRGIRGRSGSLASEIIILAQDKNKSSILYSWNTGFTLFN